ncbi:MAG: hypothetical protein MJ211_12490 [Bacteroidales bacterium]|nr:hypothetical protein [Bacteroidales bacterium]
MAAKYKLAYAGFNDTYQIASNPAHFKDIRVENCISLFDKDNCVVCYNVEVIDGIPHGFGYLDIKLNEPYSTSYHYDFDYRVLYDKTYGGEIVNLNDTKPAIFGKQVCRRRYWYVRAEMFLPDIDNRRIVAEFNVFEELPEPEEFNTNITGDQI